MGPNLEKKKRKGRATHTVDGRNPFRTTWKPWLKPLLAGIYVGEANQKPGFLRCRISQPSTVGRAQCTRRQTADTPLGAVLPEARFCPVLQDFATIHMKYWDPLEKEEPPKTKTKAPGYLMSPLGTGIQTLNKQQTTSHPDFSRLPSEAMRHRGPHVDAPRVWRGHRADGPRDGRSGAKRWALEEEVVASQARNE